MAEVAEHFAERVVIEGGQVEFGHPSAEAGGSLQVAGECFVAGGHNVAELLCRGFEEDLCGSGGRSNGDGCFFEDEVIEGESASGDDLFLRGVKEEFVGFAEERRGEPLAEYFGGLSNFGFGTGVIDIDAEEQCCVAYGRAGAESNAASSDH